MLFQSNELLVRCVRRHHPHKICRGYSVDKWNPDVSQIVPFAMKYRHISVVVVLFSFELFQLFLVNLILGGCIGAIEVGVGLSGGLERSGC